MQYKGIVNKWSWESLYRLVMGNERKARLITRLEYDNIKMTEFFNLLIDVYLEKDVRILDIIYEHLEKREKLKRKIRKLNKLKREEIAKGHGSLEKYGISKDEIQEIFDLLKNENEG